MNNISRFANIIRRRSSERNKAMQHIKDLPSVMIPIVGQELDTLLRVLYLLSRRKLEEREKLIRQTLAGEKWTITMQNGEDRHMTDRDMVEAAFRIHGWANYIYLFGCSFARLAHFHNSSDQNPFQSLSQDEQNNLLRYLRLDYKGPTSDQPDFEELMPYFPKVFKKVFDNLEYYLEDLESNSFDRVC